MCLCPHCSRTEKKNLSRIFITALCSFSYQTTTKLICESTNIARVLQETPVSAESFKATKDCRKAKQQRNQFQVPQKPIGNGFVLVLLFGSLEMQRHEEEKSHNNNPACVWRWWWRMCFFGKGCEEGKREGEMEMTLSHQLIRFYYDFSLLLFGAWLCSPHTRTNRFSNVRQLELVITRRVESRSMIKCFKSVYWLMMMECWTQASSHTLM